MAANLERLAKAFAIVGHPKIADGVNVLARRARKEGAPEIFDSQTLTHEIPTVGEGLYAQTREALAKIGLTFVVAIEPVSIGDLLEDSATKGRFGFVGSFRTMREVVPSQMEVAIDPRNVKIAESNNLSIDVQLRRIEVWRAALKRKLPQKVGDVIKVRMPSASVLAQLDFAYQRRTGKPLLPDYFARAKDPVFDSVVDVGREDSQDDNRLVISGHGWAYGDGHPSVFAVPVLVLPHKLAA